MVTTSVPQFSLTLSDDEPSEAGPRRPRATHAGARLLMLCGAWSRSPDGGASGWRRPWAAPVDPGTGVAGRTPWSSSPSAAAPSASQDDLVCHLEGRLSPQPGAPESREAAPQRTVADADTVRPHVPRCGRGGRGGAARPVLRGRVGAGRTRLHLVCDRLARQGWYVLERPGEILFATELRDLLALGAIAARHRRAVVHDVARRARLSGGPHPVRGGLAAGPGGVVCLLRRRAGSGRVHWRPTYETATARGSLGARRGAAPTSCGPAPGSTSQPASTGSSCSGGIDSSVVAAAAAEGRAPGIDVRTYSAVFPGAAV